MIWLFPIAVPSVPSCVLTVIELSEETVTTSVSCPTSIDRSIVEAVSTSVLTLVVTDFLNPVASASIT